MDDKTEKDVRRALELSEMYIGLAVSQGHLEECVVPASRFLPNLSELLDRLGRTPR